MGWEGLLESLLQDRILAYIVGALVVAVVLLLVAVRLWAGGGRDSGEQPWPLSPKRPLSEVEQTLYHRLVKALPEHIILAQVQLSQLLSVRQGYNFQEWNSRISQLCADFVVCARDATVIAVIELDAGNRDRGERLAADQRAHKALASANIRLLRWQAWALPDEESIRRQLFTPHQAQQDDVALDVTLRAIH